MSDAAQTTPCSLISRIALRHELALTRLLVDALHLGRRLLARELRDALELLLRVLVAGEDALEVQDGEAAEVADDARGARRDDAVHRRGEQRQLEPVRARASSVMSMSSGSRVRRDGHDRDVIEAVGATALLASTDLYFHGGILGSAADETGQRSNAFGAPHGPRKAYFRDLRGSAQRG